MNINAPLIGQAAIFTMILVVFLSYYLGKRKTTSPKRTELIGLVLSLIPPLAWLFVIILVFKNDIHKAEAQNEAS